MIQKFQNLPHHIRHLSIISLIAFLVSLPALIAHYPDTQDTIFAFMAFRSFSEQFYSGEFYPRWLFDFYNFYGAPMFYYYPPLIFYFEVLLDIVTLRFLPDLLILGITGFIMILASGVACYYWLKDLYGSKRAFIPSIIYMLLPNHLAIDFYLKGTLTELSSYIWMPLLFLFIRRVFDCRNSWIVVAVLYAALITSSVPMALAFSPLLLLYAGYEIYTHYKKSNRFQLSFLKPYAALLTGFSLAGFHIITAYLMTDYINQDKFWDEFYDPRTWFMCFFDCSNSSAEAISSLFSWLHTVQMLAILGLFFFCWKHKQDSRIHSGFWFIIAAGSTFMMTKYSIVLWDHIPLIERIQFPWRLAVALDFIMVLFIAKTFPFSNIKIQKIEMLMIILLLAFVTISLRHNYIYSKRDLFYDDKIIQEHWDKRDYFGVYIPPYTDVTRMDLVDDAKVDQKIWVENKQGEIKNIESERIPYGFKFEFESKTATTIHVRQLYFPTWVAYSRESGQSYNLSVSEPMGNIILDYPGGKDTIILTHKTVWQEKVGWSFTFAAFLVLAGGYFRNKRKTI